jgi:hypothetical protein
LKPGVCLPPAQRIFHSNAASIAATLYQLNIEGLYRIIEQMRLQTGYISNKIKKELQI